jgi:hypothetical protein
MVKLDNFFLKESLIRGFFIFSYLIPNIFKVFFFFL